MSWMSYKYQIQGELYWGSNAADSTYTDPNNSSWCGNAPVSAVFAWKLIISQDRLGTHTTQS